MRNRYAGSEDLNFPWPVRCPSSHPPSGVELNETRRFNINAYVKGRLIGGVEVIAVKDLIPPPIHGPSIYLLLIIALISSIYITIRLRKVKRREIEIL